MSFAPPTRPPPSDEAPPPYARAVTRVWQRRPLRGPVIFFTLIGAAWAFLSGGTYFKDISDQGNTSRMTIAEVVLGSLCMVVGLICTLGLYSAFSQNLKAIRMFNALSWVNSALFLAIGVLRLVFHMIFKDDIISQCVAYNTGDTITPQPISNSDLQQACYKSWKNGIVYDIAWLVALIFLSLFTLSIASAFYHQAKDPASSRLPASAAYRMNAYGNDQPFVPPTSYEGAQPDSALPDYKRYTGEAPPYNPGEFQPNVSDDKTKSNLGYSLGNASESTLRAVDLRSSTDIARDEDRSGGRVV